MHADHLAPMVDDLCSLGRLGADILTACNAKEDLLDLLALARTHPDRRAIAERLHRFYTRCAEAGLPELERLATTVEAAAARSCPRAATSNTSCGARAPRTYCPASSAAGLEDRCSCAAVARYWPAGRRRATSAPTPAGPGSTTTAPGSCSTATPHPARASPAGNCTNCAATHLGDQGVGLQLIIAKTRHRSARTAMATSSPARPPSPRSPNCSTSPHPADSHETSMPDTTARPTATVQNLEGQPLDRNAYAADLRGRTDTDRLGPRLELLREGEATAVAALFDELAGVYPGEDLGELARELAVRIYDRLGI